MDTSKKKCLEETHDVAVSNVNYKICYQLVIYDNRTE